MIDRVAFGFVVFDIAHKVIGVRVENSDQKEWATAPVVPPASRVCEKTSGWDKRNTLPLPVQPCSAGVTPVWIEA